MNDVDILTMLISGAAHDMDHPGTNNLFEIKNSSKLAILYNDTSILESHHAASFFFLIENNMLDCDIFDQLSSKERADVRKQIVENILGTDMSKHANI